MKWYDERIPQYVIYTLFYLVGWKFLGFEYTVIIGIGQLMGELTYIQNKSEQE